MRIAAVHGAVSQAMAEVSTLPPGASLTPILSRMASGKLVPRWARGFIIGYYCGISGGPPPYDLIHAALVPTLRRTSATALGK